MFRATEFNEILTMHTNLKIFKVSSEGQRSTIWTQDQVDSVCQRVVFGFWQFFKIIFISAKKWM